MSVSVSERRSSRLQQMLPALSAAVATWDDPEDGLVRPMPVLRTAVAEAVRWRLGSQYVRLAQEMPVLLGELARARAAATGGERQEVARLMVAAYRSADAVAYKGGAHDLSARLVDLLRLMADESGDDVLHATAAYVRTEVYFASRAHAAGLRALTRAIDAAPAPVTVAFTAARGALHMRAAVIAGRAGDEDAAVQHLDAARRLGDEVPEGIYAGTAVGPSSVRVHEVAVAVSLGDQHAGRALQMAREWKPGDELPAERQSGFYVELARAQLYALPQPGAVGGVDGRA